MTLQRGHQRRKVGWEGGIGGAVAQSAITVSADLIVSPALSILFDGLTLVRTRGQLLIFLTSATAAGGGFVGAFGIGVANTAAVVAGAGSLPTPVTEVDWDGWLFWHAIQVIAPGALAESTVSDELTGVAGMSAAQRIEIDSKAMRKIGIQDSIFGVLQVVELGSATADWFVDTRILVKLA